MVLCLRTYYPSAGDSHNFLLDDYAVHPNFPFAHTRYGLIVKACCTRYVLVKGYAQRSWRTSNRRPFTPCDSSVDRSPSQVRLGHWIVSKTYTFKRSSLWTSVHNRLLVEVSLSDKAIYSRCVRDSNTQPSAQEMYILVHYTRSQRLSTWVLAKGREKWDFYQVPCYLFFWIWPYTDSSR